MSNAAERLRAGWLSLVVGTSLFAGKGLAFVVTGSAAVFSDAMESIVNVVAAGALVWSLRIAARPADDDHPYGHGKVEFFTAGIEGVLILVAAVLIAVQAVRNLAAGTEPAFLDAGLGLLAVCAVANGALGAMLVRVGRRTHSLALEADGRHVLADVWTSVGVLAGLGLVRVTGWTVLDPLLALAVAAWIVREGLSLTRRAVEGLMDTADDDVLGRVIDALTARATDGWIDLHGLRAWRSGARLHTDLHLVVPRYWDVTRLHEVHDTVDTALADVADGDVIVHFDPCTARHCSHCAVADCAIRQHASAGSRPWTIESARRADPPPPTGS